MGTILEITDLSKKYKKIQALDRLSLKIEEGMIFGLLGPNGSGKTTTLGMLLGVIRPSSGHYSWFGNGQLDANRKRIGALLETPNFYPYLTAQQNLEIVAKIKGMNNPAARIEDVLRQVDLYDRKDTNFKTFSLGMKQRLAIASALLSDPEVLVLDEPTNGLDPQGIAEIRELILHIATTGKTIIIASHILDEIEKTCTHCAIMRKGQLLQVGTIKDILGNQNTLLIRVFANDKEKLMKVISANHEISIYRDLHNELIISVPQTMEPQNVNKYFYENGVILSELSVFQESLENQFLKIIKES
ncbi:MAG: ABC transporter ATP-binding protein [Bacteroidetes bacterium]|nr:MAG: ABC transporter ATP-binding protein [Bacteroidota bacterium]